MKFSTVSNPVSNSSQNLQKTTFESAWNLEPVCPGRWEYHYQPLSCRTGHEDSEIITLNSRRRVPLGTSMLGEVWQLNDRGLGSHRNSVFAKLELSLIPPRPPLLSSNTDTLLLRWLWTMLNLAYSSFVAAAAVSYVSAQSFVSDPLVDKTVPYTAIVRFYFLVFRTFRRTPFSPAL